MYASTLEERLDKTKHTPITNQIITLFINTYIYIDNNMITLSSKGANVQIYSRIGIFCQLRIFMHCFML